MRQSCKYREIQGWACYGKDQPLVPFKYQPRPLDDKDVEVQISHCGICGSDIHTLDSGWGPTDYPVIVGHEIIGTITAKGPKVLNLEIGDRVGIGPIAATCLQANCDACSSHQDVYCSKSTPTYNARFRSDNAKSYGGYAEAIRIQGEFAFKIPENIPSELAAPLLCAGVTVFSPLKKYHVGQGHRVGVVGIGGLGHLAIQFAKALGAEVFAISHSDAKIVDAKDLGADHFMLIKNNTDVIPLDRKLHFLLVTTSYKDALWDKYLNWMALNSRVLLLALPEAPISIRAESLVLRNISITGSLVGSISDIKEMLCFADKHHINPWVEKFPMRECNKAIQHVRDHKVRYRVVLEN